MLDSVDGLLLMQVWERLDLPDVIREAWQPVIDAATASQDRQPRDPAGFSAWLAKEIGVEWRPVRRRRRAPTNRLTQMLIPPPDAGTGRRGSSQRPPPADDAAGCRSGRPPRSPAASRGPGRGRRGHGRRPRPTACRASSTDSATRCAVLPCRPRVIATYAAAAPVVSPMATCARSTVSPWAPWTVVA